MPVYSWNPGKNDWLVRERGISFEEVVFHIENGHLLGVIQNPQRKYAHQKIFIVEMCRYIYLVPFVDSGTEIFLKTVIPSRKMTKRYLGKEER